jgi:hypothetical protein
MKTPLLKIPKQTILLENTAEGFEKQLLEKLPINIVVDFPKKKNQNKLM